MQRSDGAQKVIVSPEMRNSIRDAYDTYKIEKMNEKLPAAQLAAKKKEEEKASKRKTEMLEKVEINNESWEKRKIS